MQLVRIFMDRRPLFRSTDGVVPAFTEAPTTTPVQPIITAPITVVRMASRTTPHTLTAATITIHVEAPPLGAMVRVVRLAIAAALPLGAMVRVVRLAIAAALPLGAMVQVARLAIAAAQPRGVGALVPGMVRVAAQDPSVADLQLHEDPHPTTDFHLDIML